MAGAGCGRISPTRATDSSRYGICRPDGRFAASVAARPASLLHWIEARESDLGPRRLQLQRAVRPWLRVLVTRGRRRRTLRRRRHSRDRYPTGDCAGAGAACAFHATRRLRRQARAGRRPAQLIGSSSRPHHGRPSPWPSSSSRSASPSSPLCGEDASRVARHDHDEFVATDRQPERLVVDSGKVPAPAIVWRKRVILVEREVLRVDLNDQRARRRHLRQADRPSNPGVAWLVVRIGDHHFGRNDRPHVGDVLVRDNRHHGRALRVVWSHFYSPGPVDLFGAVRSRTQRHS